MFEFSLISFPLLLVDQMSQDGGYFTFSDYGRQIQNRTVIY